MVIWITRISLLLFGTPTHIQLMQLTHIPSLQTLWRLVNLNTANSSANSPRRYLGGGTAFAVDFLLLDHIGSALGIFILYSILFLLLILSHFHI